MEGGDGNVIKVNIAFEYPVLRASDGEEVGEGRNASAQRTSTTAGMGVNTRSKGTNISQHHSLSKS